MFNRIRIQPTSNKLCKYYKLTCHFNSLSFPLHRLRFWIEGPRSWPRRRRLPRLPKWGRSAPPPCDLTSVAASNNWLASSWNHSLGGSTYIHGDPWHLEDLWRRIILGNVSRWMTDIITHLCILHFIFSKLSSFLLMPQLHAHTGHDLTRHNVNKQLTYKSAFWYESAARWTAQSAVCCWPFCAKFTWPM